MADMISIPVDEYKKLIQAQTVLCIIQHKWDTSHSAFEVAGLVDGIYGPAPDEQEALDAE